MFEAAKMLFIYVETPLHAGSGRGLGVVDLPIQRERITNYPMVQASSLKGRLRAAFGENHPDVTTIFGKAESGEDGSHAGALAVGDARLLLFPVRSLAGVFAWTTSLDVLQRFKRDAERINLAVNWSLPSQGPAEGKVWVSGEILKAGGQVVLEEFSFEPEERSEVMAIGTWLANHTLPQQNYDYWREQLPRKLCILPEDVFRDFTQFATEVQTHIKISAATKTVEGGALWTVESLPADTMLYTPLMATQSRNNNGSKLSGPDVLQKLELLNLARTQLGGDETTGQGIVALRLNGGVK